MIRIVRPGLLVLLGAAALATAPPANAARDWTGGPVVVQPWPATAERPHLYPIVFAATITAKGEAIVVNGHHHDDDRVTASATVTDLATGATTSHAFPAERRFSSTSLATGPSGEAVLAITTGYPHRIEYFTRPEGGKVQNYAAFAPAGGDFGEPLPVGGPEDVGILSHNISLGDDGVALTPSGLRDGRAIAHWQETDPTVYHADSTLTEDSTGRYLIATAAGQDWAAPVAVTALGDQAPRTLVRYDSAGNLLLVPTEYVPALGEGIWLLEGTVEKGIGVTARTTGGGPAWAAINDAGDAMVGFSTSDVWWPRPTWWTSSVSMRRTREGVWGPMVDLTRPCRYFQVIGGLLGTDGTAIAVGLQPVGGGWPNHFDAALGGVQLLWDRPSDAEPPEAECATAPPATDPPFAPPPHYDPPIVAPPPAQGDPVQVQPRIFRIGKPRLETRRGRRYVTARFTCTIRCDVRVRSAFSAKGVKTFRGPTVRLQRRRSGVLRVPITAATRRRLAGKRRIGVVLWGHANVKGLPPISALELGWLRLPRGR